MIRKKEVKFPLATICFYGPDDKTPVKIAVGIINKLGGDTAVLKRWVGTDVTTNPKVKREILEFIREHKAKQFVIMEGVIGCIHEEGLDYPEGMDCPYCPFWKGKKTSRFNKRLFSGEVKDDFSFETK